MWQWIESGEEKNREMPSEKQKTEKINKFHQPIRQKCSVFFFVLLEDDKKRKRVRALKMQRTEKIYTGIIKCWNRREEAAAAAAFLFDNIRKYVARHNAEKVNLCLDADVGIDKQEKK